MLIEVDDMIDLAIVVKTVEAAEETCADDTVTMDGAIAISDDVINVVHNCVACIAGKGVTRMGAAVETVECVIPSMFPHAVLVNCIFAADKTVSSSVS